MTVKDFLEGKPVTVEDLFGQWKQRGFREDSPEASKILTTKLNFMRVHLGKLVSKESRVGSAWNVGELVCKFKRCDVHGKGCGEWMRIDRAGETFKIFSASVDGFVDETAAPAQEDAPAAKEITGGLPTELRHSWFNYGLAAKLTDQCNAEYDEWEKKQAKK